MAAEVPKTMKAFVIAETGKPGEVRDINVPSYKEDEILVKISHVSLNPTDWKHLYQVGAKGSILGCDYAGTVAAIGSAAQGWSIGDKACGFIHGGKFPDRGSYAEYGVVKADQAYKVPSNLAMEAAPTYGVAYTTAGMVLYHEQQVPYPPAKVEGDKWYLVSGGSTSVGLYLIPLLKIAGLRVIATASPHSFDLVKKYGADHVVDYHDADKAIAEIQKVTGGGVWKALEAVGGDENFKISIKSFAKEGGQLTTLTLIPEGAEKFREEVKIDRVLLYTVGGYSFEFIPGRPPLPAIPKDHDWHVGFIKQSADLMGEKYAVPPNPLDVREGLAQIQEGLDQLKDNKVSGKKLVYKIA